MLLSASTDSRKGGKHGGSEPGDDGAGGAGGKRGGGDESGGELGDKGVGGGDGDSVACTLV